MEDLELIGYDYLWRVSWERKINFDFKLQQKRISKFILYSFNLFDAIVCYIMVSCNLYFFTYLMKHKFLCWCREIVIQAFVNILIENMNMLQFSMWRMLLENWHFGLSNQEISRLACSSTKSVFVWCRPFISCHKNMKVCFVFFAIDQFKFGKWFRQRWKSEIY